MDHLIQEVLIEERKAQTQFKVDQYTLRWTFDNELEIVLVACYLSQARLPWVDDFLVSVKNDFIAQHRDNILSRKTQAMAGYKARFDRLLDKYETSRGASTGGMRAFNETAKGRDAAFSAGRSDELKDVDGRKPAPTTYSLKGNAGASAASSSAAAAAGAGDDAATATDAGDTGAAAAAGAGGAAAAGAEDAAAIGDGLAAISPSLQRRGSKAPRTFKEIQAAKAANKGGAGTSEGADSNPSTSHKGGKKMADRWDGSANKTEAAALDLSDSKGAPEGGVSQEAVSALRRIHGEGPRVGEGGKYAEVDDDDDDVVADETKASEGKVWGFFKGLVGQKELSREDLIPVAKGFTDLLIQKNVAASIAEKLVDNVVMSLVGKRLGTFNTMQATVRAELEGALTRLLTPSRPVDVMAGVVAAKTAGRPYTVVMCGVNGVGKSTSLAKIAAYFRSHDLRVGVAACDTFRSGAVEQLRVHCKALELPLFDRGYGSDEARVAFEGVQWARKDGLDVLMIDTAGRMQGKDTLMKGLAKLIAINNPDLILFVGEALVGNDGCDQLLKFNEALKTNSDQAHPRVIDGIVLTKFDTIDDKVGAAISMTYSTGHPIIFVGTGQSYKDLKRPNAKLMIRALLN